MKTFIYFVRHAISPFSLGNERVRGLSREGKADADRVAEVLSKEEIDVIASSPYTRAIETVQPLANQLGKEIIEFEELRERAIASMRYEIGEEKLMKAMERSFADIDFCLGEGETTRQARNRAIPTLKHILMEHQGNRIAIGTHGNIMTIMLNYFNENYGFDFFTRTSKPDIYKLEFEDQDLKHVVRLWQPR